MKVSVVIFLLLCVVYTGISALKELPKNNLVALFLEKDLISSKCMKSLKLYLERLNNYYIDDNWAFRMLDATSKIPVGLLSYNFGEMGDFQQCIEIESKRDHIQGKFCIGNIIFNSSSSILLPIKTQNLYLEHVVSKLTGVVHRFGYPTWTMCLPSNCSDQDAKYVMSISQPIAVGVEDVSCQTIEDVYPHLDKKAVFGITILVMLIMVVFISTGYDLYCQKYSRTARPGYTAFSIYTNGKTLFQIPKRSSSLSCLDGLRVISMMWIILLHTYSVYRLGPVFNVLDIVKLTDSIFSMVFVNGDLACDTFLLVGGTLVTYVFFKKEKKWQITFPNVMKHYLHRYIRLTPSLAGVVLVSATLLKYMGSGPKWPYIVKYFQDICTEYWWTSLLYIQNETNVKGMCVGHSWYLNVDMQLYLFSPLILWLLHKYRKTGITMVISSLLASISTAFFRAYKKELSAIHSNYFSKTPSTVYMEEYYLRTETRAAPWLIGIILGYIIARYQVMETRLSKKILIPMWIISLSVMMLCVVGGHRTLRGPEYYRLENAIYIASVRPAFALAVSWIIWACATNHGGVINTILSFSVFQFLNKFIYSMYLLHVTSIFMIVFSQKTSSYVTVFNLVYWYCGICIMMFGLSIIWVIIFERPMINLEKVILQKLENYPHS